MKWFPPSAQSFFAYDYRILSGLRYKFSSLSRRRRKRKKVRLWLGQPKRFDLVKKGVKVRSRKKKFHDAESYPDRNQSIPGKNLLDFKYLEYILFLSIKQECIPVRCVPSTAVAVPPATHAPLPHIAPLPCMSPPCTPPPTHAPPPAMPAPLPHTHPCHACPLSSTPPCHAHPLPHTSPCYACPPPPDRILGTRLWKHCPSATTVADGNEK